MFRTARTPPPHGSHGTYVLEDRQPVLVDVSTWKAWMDDANRSVDRTEFHTPSQKTVVDTAFLGLDVWVMAMGPFFFATTAVCGKEFVTRYSQTWDEAQRVHDDIVADLKAAHRGAKE